MEKNDFIEQIIGGIFAIIAVGAAIAELVINGISSATIASCIKIFSGKHVNKRACVSPYGGGSRKSFGKTPDQNSMFFSV